MTWEGLKRLGGSTLAKYVILVPIFGWIIVLHSQFSAYLESELALLSTEGLEWRVHCFFVGLCLVALSSFVFLWQCPPEISEFKGEADFVDREMRLITQKSAVELAERLSISEPEFLDFDQLDQAEGLADRPIWIRNNETVLLDLLRSGYAVQNESAFWTRWFATIAFFAGSVLTLVPTMIAVWRSLRVVFGIS